MPIAHLRIKHNKGFEKDKISNRHDGFAEDVEIGNAEWKEESVKRAIETG